MDGCYDAANHLDLDRDGRKAKHVRIQGTQEEQKVIKEHIIIFIYNHLQEMYSRLYTIYTKYKICPKKHYNTGWWEGGERVRGLSQSFSIGIIMIFRRDHWVPI